jgi:hypothetical protein
MCLRSFYFFSSFVWDNWSGPLTGLCNCKCDITIPRAQEVIMPLPRTFVGFSSTDIDHADTAIDSDFIALDAHSFTLGP